MKYPFLLLLITVSLSAGAQTNPRLAKTIDSMYVIDQQVQLDLKALSQAGASAEAFNRQDSIKKQTFIRHIAAIKQLYKQYGYPTTKLVGTEASHHFFVLIQHADSDPTFQASMLPILEKLAKKGNISIKDYAYLYDRVQRNTGGKQLYGTQLSYNSKGSFFDDNNKIIYPADLADPANVDQRRKKVGLGPIEEYYESVLQMLGRPRPKS